MGQTFTYNHVKFHQVDYVGLPENCGNDPFEGLYGDFVMEHVQGAECGTWFFNVSFGLENSDFPPPIYILDWYEHSTGQWKEGYYVEFHISDVSSTIRLKVTIKTQYCTFFYEAFVDISQDEPCTGCTSVMNYCDMTEPCLTSPLVDAYQRLNWAYFIKMETNECIKINDSYYNPQNPGGIFRMPYKIYSDQNCDIGDPDLYDFIDDLNIWLSAPYGHYGYAYARRSNAPGDCKFKIVIVDSDVVFDKSIDGCYYLYNEYDENGFPINCRIQIREFDKYYHAESQICYGQDVSNYTNVCDFPQLTSGLEDENNTMDDLNFKLYPVVSEDIINIEFDSRQYIGLSYRIIDLVGRVVKKGGFVSDGNVKQINTNELSRGTYFLHISSSLTGRAHVEKFIKQ